MARICFIGRTFPPAPFSFPDFLLSALSSEIFFQIFFNHFFNGIYCKVKLFFNGLVVDVFELLFGFNWNISFYNLVCFPMFSPSKFTKSNSFLSIFFHNILYKFLIHCYACKICFSIWEHHIKIVFCESYYISIHSFIFLSYISLYNILSFFRCKINNFIL